MAADLSKIIPENLSITLGALLAKETKLKECTKADIRDFQGNELLRVDVEFVFEKLTSLFSYYIPASSASNIFNIMMAAPEHEVVSKIDDDIKDAMEEFISNTCGGLVTTINAEAFEDIGKAKFNIQHKEIVDGNSVDSIENNYRFLIDIDETEVIIFTKFQDNFTNFIEELTKAEITYYPPEVENKEEEEVEEENLKDEKGTEPLKEDEPIDEGNENKNKKKKMIIIAGVGLLVVILLVMIILFTLSSSDEEPIKKPQELNTTKVVAPPIKITQYDPPKKIDFKMSDININRLNNKFELLTKYQVLTQEELEQQALEEKSRIIALKKEQALIEFAKENKEEPLDLEMIQNSKKKEVPSLEQSKILETTSQENSTIVSVQEVQKEDIQQEVATQEPIDTKLKFVLVNSIKYSFLKELVKKINSSTARISICNNENGKTQIYIGPFENEALQIKMNTLIQDEAQEIQTIISNLTQNEFDTRCNF